LPIADCRSLFAVRCSPVAGCWLLIAACWSLPSGTGTDADADADTINRHRPVETGGSPASRSESIRPTDLAEAGI
jgi:hypothetical protein